MKTAIRILFPFFLLLSFSTCAPHYEQRISAKTYHFHNAFGEEWAWIELRDDGTFEFNRSNATSYRPSGSYKVVKEEVILTVDENEQYCFTIQDQDLLFKDGTFALGILAVGSRFEAAPEE
ncbi:MAG: hypothetical protein ACRDBX_08565 [Erysipelotrichaceae bacterium]